MILWKKYNEKNLDNILGIVGIGDTYPNRVFSHKFIVWVKFDYPNAKFEARYASILKTDGRIHLLVEGMQGNIFVSHYSKINLPSK